MRRETLKVLGNAVACAVLVIAFAALPLHSQAEPPDASVSVVPQPRPHTDAIARVARVTLEGRSLRLEIENTGSLPITALTVLYEASSCSTGNVVSWATDSRLPQRNPSSPLGSSETGVITELPAHSRIWYDDYQSPSSIANWALHKKTRYVQAQAEVIGVVLKDGTRIQWKRVAAPEQALDGFDRDACVNWPWSDKLNVITGTAIYPPEASVNANEIVSKGLGVTYSCKVVDDLLHCPRR